MKLYAPQYYKTFQCIADRCEHSCCIGWEIDIDEHTLKRYKQLKNGYGTLIAKSIALDDTPHFRLGAHDRCPHLDERGLCRIILNVGEDYLCDICREHPRFYNFTSVAEVGLGLSCPEAARIVLSSPDYATLEEIGSVETVADDVNFNGRAERDKIYHILQNRSLDYPTKLESIYKTYAIDVGKDDQWLEILDSLEYLDADHKPLLMQYASGQRSKGTDEYTERFLAYLIYRHCTEAFDTEDFGVRLAFCLFCERLLASLIAYRQAQSLQEIAALASIISEEIEYSDDNTLALMETTLY